LSLFRYFEVGLRVCDIVVKKFTFAISSPGQFMFKMAVAAILDFRNFKLLMVGTVKRVELHHYAKFR